MLTSNTLSVVQARHYFLVSSVYKAGKFFFFFIPMDDIVSLSSRFSKSNLLSAGIAAAAAQFALGRRAASLLRSERGLPSTSTMPRLLGVMPSYDNRRFRGRYPTRPRYKRRYGGSRYVKTGMVSTVKSFARMSGINALPISASGFGSSTLNVTLAQVLTSDLTSIYRLYKIKKCIVHLCPRVDPANSGLVNNQVAMVSAACDPEGVGVAPASTQVITAYDNSYSKQLAAGDHFRYTFYPKVTNTVDVGGTATASGSYAFNPWLKLNATGITIPHLQLLLAAQTGASTTMNFDYYIEIHFLCKGIV